VLSGGGGRIGRRKEGRRSGREGGLERGLGDEARKGKRLRLKFYAHLAIRVHELSL
jgi:hypothetical protein